MRPSIEASSVNYGASQCSTAWESHHHAWEKSSKLPYVEQPADVVHVMLDAIQSVDTDLEC